MLTSSLDEAQRKVRLPLCSPASPEPACQRTTRSLDRAGCKQLSVLLARQVSACWLQDDVTKQLR